MPGTEKRAFQILENTTTKSSNQNTIKLLWENDNVALNDNKSFALSRLFSVEKKFASNPSLAEKYKETMRNYTLLLRFSASALIKFW